MKRIFKQINNFLKSYKQENNWAVISSTWEDDDLILVYQYDEWSDTIIKDRTTYIEFQKYFSVTTGFWYGEYGYWLTNKRIEKAILCKHVSEFKENKFLKEDRSIELIKKVFTSLIKVEIESRNIGTLNFKCQSIESLEHLNVGLYSNADKKYLLYKELSEDGSTFIGKIAGNGIVQKFSLEEFEILDFELDNEK